MHVRVINHDNLTRKRIAKSVFFAGGKLIFDEKDVELHAENILITDNGLLQVCEYTTLKRCIVTETEYTYARKYNCFNR